MLNTQRAVYRELNIMNKIDRLCSKTSISHKIIIIFPGSALNPLFI